MQAENSVNRELLEQPIVNHHPGATLRLLGWLENEINRTVEIQTVFVLRQVARSTKENRGMPIMTTGMHPPLMFGAVGEFVFLKQGQGIHVGT